MGKIVINFLGEMGLKRQLLLTLLVFILTIRGGNQHEVFATSTDSPQPIEEIFPSIGFKTVEAALMDFEQHFKQELKLPLRVPPIAFTHHLARFTNADGEMNDDIEIVMINELAPHNHFKIEVRPIQHKIPFSEQHELKVLKLKNGSRAFYTEKAADGFNLLVFERENWQYIFSIDKDVANQVPAEMLVDIANSIDYKIGNS